MSEHETELVEAARDGDSSAFASLVGGHRQRLYNVCYRICGNHHDAEDALQNALALAWRNLAKFRGASGFGTWVYRIASNTSLELIRRRKDETSLDEDVFGNEVQLADTAPRFEDQITDNDRLNTALESISAEAREALVLQAVGGLKISEIAAHQKSSVSATKVRLHRARKTLQEILQG